MATRLGIIADTHGLIRPEALAALAGCERILHAGDVGASTVLDALARVAPVEAVRGNVDDGFWAHQLPQTLSLTVEQVHIHVLHNLAELGEVSADVVISGHSHKAKVEQRERTLYLNPGSAGPRRFSLPLSVALLNVDGSSVRAEIVPLETA